MRKLETYVNEKLRVTSDNIYVPELSALLNSKDMKEFNYGCMQLSEYLKNNSNLPTAEMKNLDGSIKRLSKKYENSYDTFLWVKNNMRIFYGTWDELYSVYWSRANNIAKCYNPGIYGFKEFIFNTQELSESGNVYVITENSELMKQIDYLTRNAE